MGFLIHSCLFHESPLLFLESNFSLSAMVPLFLIIPRASPSIVL